MNGTNLPVADKRARKTRFNANNAEAVVKRSLIFNSFKAK